MLSDKNPKTALLHKLNAIMNEIGIVPKKGHVSGPQNYDYATERDIKEALKPLLVSHKVQLVPVDIENLIVQPIPKTVERTDRGVTTITQTTTHLTTFIMRWKWIDCETGEELQVASVGQGWDQNDKGSNKGETGAIKKAIAHTFMLITGDDPEADSRANEPQQTTSKQPVKTSSQNGAQPKPAATEEQIKELEDVLHEAGITGKKAKATLEKLSAFTAVQEVTDYLKQVKDQIETTPQLKAIEDWWAVIKVPAGLTEADLDLAIHQATGGKAAGRGELKQKPELINTVIEYLKANQGYAD